MTLNMRSTHLQLNDTSYEQTIATNGIIHNTR